MIESSTSAPSLLGENGDIETGDWATLLNAYRNKAKYKIHASSLNDYLRANMIPRGLRIQKGPEMFKSNDTFLQKWKAILNQCSTDIMLLIMEFSMQTVDESEKEITELETKLQADSDSNFENKMKKIEEEINKLERNMKEFKIRKYKRDTKDYANEAVYNFKSRPFAKKVLGQVTPIRIMILLKQVTPQQHRGTRALAIGKQERELRKDVLMRLFLGCARSAEAGEKPRS